MCAFHSTGTKWKNGVKKKKKSAICDFEVSWNRSLKLQKMEKDIHSP